jgi:hypothetical protein
MPSNNESVFAQWLDPEKKIPEVDPANELLEWLVYRWAKPTVTAINIRQFGPRPIRDRDSVMKLTEILVQRGKLIPIKTHRADKFEWHVVREPERLKLSS